ncbi:HhH-GPD-type base excision DNA repair protein [soil metagenome]
MVAGSDFYITGDPEADGLLGRDPLALLLGMMLDQQVPMEWAFASPAKLAARLGGLDASAIAAMDPEALESAFKEKPALHRYPGSMARRAHELCRHLVETYDGRAERVWTDVATGDELLQRLAALPGFGQEKARIFLAVLAKRLGVRPPGWEEAAAPFSDDQRRSVADVTSPETLQEVRANKAAKKAAGKGKAD